MANVVYTVVKNDTLSEIAVKYNTSVSALLKLNPDITNRDLIYVGQKIIVSGTAATPTKNKTQKAKITNFGVQTRTDRTMFATWSWDKDNTAEYQVRWKYATGDGVAFNGNIGTETSKQSVWTAPENATKVTFEVRPISTTRTVNGKQSHRWKADWSTIKRYEFGEIAPDTPPVPTVKLEEATAKKLPKITAKVSFTVSAWDEIVKKGNKPSKIQFEIRKDGRSSVFKTGTANVKEITGDSRSEGATASFATTVDDGGVYTVRCRAVRSGMYSEWSEYQANLQGTSDPIISKPAAISAIHEPKRVEDPTTNDVGIYISWDEYEGAKHYHLQWATSTEHFNSSSTAPTDVQISAEDNGSIFSHYTLVLGNPNNDNFVGRQYFFRVRVSTDKDAKKYSVWSPIVSIEIGKEPAAPQTWSYTTNAVVGEPITLYWLHQATDGSEQTDAEIELKVEKGDNDISTYVLSNSNGDFDISDSEEASYCTIDTTQYTEGSKIFWRVRTSGLMRDSDGNRKFSEWSEQREIDVYAKPTLDLYILNSTGNEIDDIVLESFPFTVRAEAGPDTNPDVQKPLGYYINITANNYYETVDQTGNNTVVNAGNSVFYRYFDINDFTLEEELSAGDMSLENNQTYTLYCTVAMTSGLEATVSKEFTVGWSDEDYYWPDAEISYDPETCTASINPYCLDDDGQLAEGITLAVYRREYDGRLVELASGLSNVESTFVTDPHPALDYARYRIVSMSDDTGSISFYDVPGYPIQEKGAVIQWDEDWTNFDGSPEDSLEEPVWSGSLLRLLYNVDVSDDYTVDAELVKYIGREHPVSYYGTHVDHTSNWTMVIPQTDIETLYALRRLSRWKGNVYVREPSGSGYWANIAVSISQKHLETTTSVTLRITRVEGGI